MSHASEDCTVQGGGRCGTCRWLAVGCRNGSLSCYIPYLSDAVSGAFFSARSSGSGRSASVGSASTAVATAAAATLLVR
jgi:hypothetical protein